MNHQQHQQDKLIGIAICIAVVLLGIFLICRDFYPGINTEREDSYGQRAD